jgi:hypothetical protein
MMKKNQIKILNLNLSKIIKFKGKYLINKSKQINTYEIENWQNYHAFCYYS